MKHAFSESGPIIASVGIAIVAWVSIALLMPDTWVYLKPKWCVLGWVPTIIITILIVEKLGGFE